jgi:hypothetical protein
MDAGKGVEHVHHAAKKVAESHPLHHVGEHPMMHTEATGSEEGAANRADLNASIRSYGFPPDRMPMDQIVQRR